VSLRRYYFSTRDLLLMAALAALGGLTSTYINVLGRLVYSLVGAAGMTQWAAGLHVLWLVLAVGLTRKQGAGTIAGLLKGAVELLSGNTHGVVVVLVDVVAGLLVDLGFLPFRNKDSFLAYGLAGGLAAGSNVLIFQLFAALPADILSYGGLGLLAFVAFASGVLFGGLLALLLVNALRRAGVVRDQPARPLDRRLYLAFLAAGLLLALGLGIYLRFALSGPRALSIEGAVNAPYTYPRQNGDIPYVTAEATLRGDTARYSGVPLKELVARAGPEDDAAYLLVRSTDGYAFFIPMAEVRESGSLLLVPKGNGYDLVGPANAKAWVRNVARLAVAGPVALPIEGALERPAPFYPEEWQFRMDAATLDLGAGPAKYQGVALGLVLQEMGPQPQASTVAVYGADPQEPAVTLPLAQVLAEQEVRLFVAIGDADISFALARMDGQVMVPQVERVEVR